MNLYELLQEHTSREELKRRIMQSLATRYDFEDWHTMTCWESARMCTVQKFLAEELDELLTPRFKQTIKTLLAECGIRVSKRNHTMWLKGLRPKDENENKQLVEKLTLAHRKYSLAYVRREREKRRAKQTNS